MIEHLFGSKTRVKLLHVFYTNPNRSFYVREITRKIDEQINSVRRELSNLLSIGVIKSNTSGNKLFYEVNQNHPHYQAMRSIFMNLDSEEDSNVGYGGDNSAKFKDLGSVDYAHIGGVFTKDPVAPVDVLIVGDVNRSKLEKLIAQMEEEEGSELRYTVLSRADFDYRSNLNDRFLSSALDSKKTILIDRIGVEKVEPDAQEQSQADVSSTDKDDASSNQNKKEKKKKE